MTMRFVYLLNRLMNDLDQHVKRRLNNDIVVAARRPGSGGARLSWHAKAFIAITALQEFEEISIIQTRESPFEVRTSTMLY